MINNSTENESKFKKKENKNVSKFQIISKYINDDEQGEIIRSQIKNATFAPVFYQSLPKIAGVFSILIGILVMIGWIINSNVLKSVFQEMVTMKPNTALCFILSGAALRLLEDKKYAGILRKIGLIFSIAVFAIGFLIVCEYSFGFDFGIDYVLFKEKVSAEPIQWGGRMSVISAASFGMIGISLFLLNFRNKNIRFLSQIIVLFIAVYSLIIFAGFIYEVKSLYAFPIKSAIALHTTITFFVLSVGTLFVHKEQGIPQIVLKNSFGGMLIRRLVPAALVFPLLLSWIKMKGVEAELYSSDFGLAIIASANVIVFISLVVWTARSLDQIDEQRKNAQKTVRESLKELADIKFALDESAIVAITDLENKLTYVNDFFCEISKYSREELIGTVRTFIDTKYHVEGFREDILKTIRSGEIWRGEIRNLAKDNSIYWADTTIVPLSDDAGNPHHFVTIRFDITARKLAEEKSIEEKIFSNFTIESLPAIFYLYDLNGKFIRWNKNFEQVSGYSGEEVLKMHPLDFFAEDEKQLLEERIGEVFEKDEATVEADFLTKQGNRIPYFFTGKKIFYKNQICLVGMGIDMTEFREAKEALRNSEERYRDLFENNPFPMMVYDFETLDILAVNDATIFSYGYSREEFSEMTMLNIRPSEEIPRFLENLKNPHGTINNFGIWNHQKKNGEIINVDITSHELIYDGKNARLVLANDVTEKKRAEDALRESEMRYRDLFENNPFPMWVYELETLNFLAVNDAAKFQYGYTETEFLSMTIKDIRPPEDIPLLLDNVAQVAKTIENSGVWKHLTKDGTLIFVEITSHELWFDGKLSRLVLVNDVTEKKKAEEKLIESQRQFRELSESLPQLVWTCRGDGYCDYLSPQWVNYTGKPEAEQLGSVWLEQIHPKDREMAFKSWSAAVESKENLDVEFRIRRWDGVYHWFKTLAVPHKDFDGNVVRWFGTNTDIEEEKQFGQKILLLNETLEQRVFERTAELETVNKELESFSYSVSHDLRAPLRAIDGFSQALLEDCAAELNNEGRHYLERVRLASQQMAHLIEDLLNLSRVTRREINRGEVNLTWLADNIARNLQEMNSERKMKFNIEENLLVNGDEGLLRIVLENLMGNACKFTAKTENAEISFGKQIFDEKNWFFVQDNGAGFDMKYADKLFGAFQRLHGKNEFEGTGIGLATVQRILNRHGGFVRAEGKIGEGAIFYFTI
jgi:PAS domain S-box-containing protein